MTPPLRILSALLAAAVLALLTLAGAGPALAARGVGHHQGVVWAGDHSSWIGSYQLDDGNVGYCIDVARPQPLGSDFNYVDGSTIGAFSPPDAARLAYISRHWGNPSDPLTAAAAQLATWTVAGLGGHDQAYYAKRANDAADDVLTSANRILELANSPGGASTGVRAQASLMLAGASGTARSDLVVDYLAGPGTLPPGSFPGTMTLQGATFEGGARTRPVTNGEEVRILPDQHGATESVVVDVSYSRLPFGPGFRYGRNGGAGQNLLVGAPFTTDAAARAQASGPSGLPFRPRVATTTSTPVASAGAVLTDTLRLDTHPDSPTAPEWGVFAVADGLTAPIPVVITSVLHGPYPAPPQPADTAPIVAPAPAPAPTAPASAPADPDASGASDASDASIGADAVDASIGADAVDASIGAGSTAGSTPAVGGVVCTVETRVITGPGTYESPPCTLPAPGFYVWTDFIDRARTPPEQGGDRLQPWQSRFGEATETTLVPATPTILTEASYPTLVGAGCVSDRLTVTGLPAGIDPLPVRSTLLGPLTALPEPETVPAGWRGFPVAGTVTTSVPSDGTYESPCIPINRPGHYYFIIASDAAVPFPPAPTTPKATPPTAPDDGPDGASPSTPAAGAGAGADAGSAITPDSAPSDTRRQAHTSSSPADPSAGSVEPPMLIPAISDLRVHVAEAVHLTVPTVTIPPARPSPPAPSPTPPPSTAPAVARLAQTGGPSTTAMPIALAVSTVILSLAGAGLLAGRRR
jgi:hypothetical protein